MRKEGKGVRQVVRNQTNFEKKDDTPYLEVHTVTALCNAVLPILSCILTSAPSSIRVLIAPSSSLTLPWKCMPLTALCKGRIEGSRSFQYPALRLLPFDFT